MVYISMNNQIAWNSVSSFSSHLILCIIIEEIILKRSPEKVVIKEHTNIIATRELIRPASTEEYTLNVMHRQCMFGTDVHD